jgi:putative ATPase
VKQDGTRPVPMHLRNAPTQLMKQLDYGKGYRYAHDEEGGFAAGERYLPDGMAAPGFYSRCSADWRSSIADKLEELRQRNAQAAVDVTHLPKNADGREIRSQPENGVISRFLMQPEAD